MPEETGFGRDFLTKLIRGIMKLILASFIISAVSSINIPDLTVGSAVVSGALLKAILEFIIPIAIIISALNDFGVEI
jgi:hypothetical protein